MDDDYEEEGCCFRVLFRSVVNAFGIRWFVCISLSALLAIHLCHYVWPGEMVKGDLSDVKYVVFQLTKGLSEVNRKHESLKSQIERISSELPPPSASASRGTVQAKCCRSQALVQEYDQQLADYALESAGGRIVDTGDTVDYKVYESPISHALFLMSAILCRECVNARAIIRPGTMPGECWAFKGSKGEATIRLVGTIQVTGVSIEHIPSHIAPTREISSAPRMFQLEGLLSKYDPAPHDFGTFQYEKDGQPIQYFQIRHDSPNNYNLVRLKILNNWGHPVYTCLYRVRIHGDLAPGQVPHVVVTSDLKIENQ